jgi:transcriptional regulator with XRE-family HTH domain
MTVPAPFGKRLKQARELANLSQKKLGILAGIEESNASAIMNQYERGTHLPKFPLVRNIARALNVPAAYFFADEDEIAELLILYGTLSNKNQSAVLMDIKKSKQTGNYEKDYHGRSINTIHE